MRRSNLLLLPGLFVAAVTFQQSSFLQNLAYAIFVLDAWSFYRNQTRLEEFNNAAPTAVLRTLGLELMGFSFARLVMLHADQLWMEGSSFIIVCVLCTNASSTLTSCLASIVSSSLLYLRLFWRLYVWPGRRGQTGATSTGSECTPSVAQLASKRTRKSPASTGFHSARASASSTRQKQEPNCETFVTLEKNGDGSPLSSLESVPPDSVSNVLNQSGDSWQRLPGSLSSSDTSPIVMERISVTGEHDVGKVLSTVITLSKRPYSSTTKATDDTRNTELTGSGFPVPAVKIDTDSDSATSNRWSTGSAGSGKSTGQNQTTFEVQGRRMWKTLDRMQAAYCWKCGETVWPGDPPPCPHKVE